MGVMWRSCEGGLMDDFLFSSFHFGWNIEPGFCFYIFRFGDIPCTNRARWHRFVSSLKPFRFHVVAGEHS
jgi:hypothetical protein